MLVVSGLCRSTVWGCGSFCIKIARAAMSGDRRCYSHANRTASVIIIGDEILKGQVRDTNSYFFAKQLHALGVKLEKVSVIGDCVDEIGTEVRNHSRLYDFVLTSGGVGPTHDDLTFQGVARAFDDTLQLHDQLRGFVAEYFHTQDISKPCFKLAQVPSKARLLYGEDRVRGTRSKFPTVQVHNVYVFPGIPSLLEKAFHLLAEDYFRNRDRVFHSDTLYLSVDELSVADILTATTLKFPHASIGSYPKLYHSYYKTRVTLECDSASDLSSVRQHLTDALPTHTLVSFNEDVVSRAWSYLQPLSASQPYVSRSVELLQQCTGQYSWDEICVCFNGGKDCTAVLHLVHSLAAKQDVLNGGNASQPLIRAVYIRDSKPFPDLERFIEQTRVRYNIDLFTTSGPLKQGLHNMLEHWPSIKACVMGTRHGDPHSAGLQQMQLTDADWPSLMRVHAILHWRYDELWRFVRTLCLPYCTLYDKGYTSLGCVDDTLPNPSLQTNDADGRVIYRPAYELTDASLERAGRIKPV